ncbi:glyoxylate reductase [Aspergillus novoparasiticus]|uniref:Glyoxylate reductase n=1 Tax=Aspergillus novoparasiticus TaxID=986946 RepID=A0A5N6EPI8_9EURO|nr:glyoxylate reductase [Aspergillus novoparasiticus]
MGVKADILFIESPVQAVDTARRETLAKNFNLLYYDCDSVNDFIERLKLGGQYSGVVAIVHNGWHKVGKFASERLFAPEVVPHFPPCLRIICCSGHGYDASDVKGLSARGIWFCNTPGACTEAVSNTAWFLVLDTFRYLSYAQWCARYDWNASRELGLTASDPCGQSLGIICAEELLRNGAIYHSRISDMIPELDCIVLAAPYSDETHHLLSTNEFALAKNTGLRVVNIARGKIIDEEALIEALAQGKVVGAGLDVHEMEPGVNSKLKDNWKVTLLPHIGVCSSVSWQNFEKINLDNLEAFLTTG